jgi:hypothetical protein
MRLRDDAMAGYRSVDVILGPECCAGMAVL